MYMMIAATLFAEYPTKTRMSYVKKYYDAISQHKINIPTPVMAGVNSIRQFASCVLVDSDDTLPSIFSSDMAIGLYVARRAGIGINAGRIRGINSKIRGGGSTHRSHSVPKEIRINCEMLHTEWCAWWKRNCTLPDMAPRDRRHPCAKNNKGTEDNRVRRMDYSIQISKLFYEIHERGRHNTYLSTPGTWTL